jgi:hypothetical protein
LSVALASFHLRGSRLTNSGRRERQVWGWLFFLQPVAFRTKAVNIVNIESSGYKINYGSMRTASQTHNGTGEPTDAVNAAGVTLVNNVRSLKLPLIESDDTEQLLEQLNAIIASVSVVVSAIKGLDNSKPQA